MTEQEWLTAIPTLMMQHIHQVNPASCRKLRLLAVAWARFLESQPDYADAKHVSHLGEEVLEGRQDLDFLWDDTQRGWGYEGDWSIANFALADDAGLDMAIRKSMWYSECRGRRAGLDVTPRLEMARSLVLCILGNPFRPAAVDPLWRTSTVLRLARTIYEDRAFDLLPILADALEDAGCHNEDILAHLRSDKPHSCGCWPVDLMLEKS